MSSTNKTSAYGLSQFERGDSPGMEDWNEDNRRIVAALIEVGKAASKPPYVGENLNWWIYDPSIKAYIDSGVRAPGERGPDGPANQLAIGTVEAGEEAVATITGEAPNQLLNLILPRGEQGLPGTGTGYMKQDVYDPNAKNADAFSMENMEESETKKVLTDVERTKLAGIENEANNYTHPVNHDPSIITQDQNNRFVTDEEKATWNGKQNALGFTPVNETDFNAHKSRHERGGVDAVDPANLGENGVAQLSADGKVANQYTELGYQTKSANYQLVAGDEHKMTQFTATANVTIPASTFDVGLIIPLCVTSGTVTVVAGSGVNLIKVRGMGSASANAIVCLVHLSGVGDPEYWLVVGGNLP